MGRMLSTGGMVLIFVLIVLTGDNSALAGEIGFSNNISMNYQGSASMLSQSEMSLMIEQEFGEEGYQCTSEIYMAELADYMKNQRILGGISGLIGGGITVALAAGYDKDKHESDFDYQTYGVVTGIGSIVIGIYQLAVPSKAEKEFARMQGITDLEEREKYGANSLESFSHKAQTGRIIGGGILAFAGGILLAAQPIEEDDGEESDWNYYLGAAAGVGAILAFAIKSKPEKIYDKYLKAKGQEEIGLYLGPDGRGGGMIGITYSF